MLFFFETVEALNCELTRSFQIPESFSLLNLFNDK